MGFLRKIGRKVNKKLSKIFGAKMGKIVGMVGLYFVMGAAAKQLSGWSKSMFGKGTAATTNAGTKAVELTAGVGESVAAQIDTTAALAKDSLLTVDSAKGADLITSTLDKKLASSNISRMDEANNFIAKSESLVKSGQVNPSLSTSPTDLIVEAAANTDQILSQTNADVLKTLNEPIDFTDADFLEKSLEFNMEGTVTPRDPTQGMGNIAKTINDPGRFGTLGPDATFGEQINRFASDPLGVTRGALDNAATASGDYIKGDFVPDTAKTLGSAAISNYFNPQEDMTGGGGYVSGQPAQEGAQASYMQDMTPQLSGLGLGNIRSFTDMANQTLYGTGAPSHIQHMYQPLPTPTIKLT